MTQYFVNLTFVSLNTLCILFISLWKNLTNFRQNIWHESIKVISRIKDQRIIIAQDAAKKQPQAACATSNRLNYFWGQRLRNYQRENNINVINAQKLDTRVNQELFAGFAPQQVSNFFDYDSEFQNCFFQIHSNCVTSK